MPEAALMGEAKVKEYFWSTFEREGVLDMLDIGAAAASEGGG